MEFATHDPRRHDNGPHQRRQPENQRQIQDVGAKNVTHVDARVAVRCGQAGHQELRCRGPQTDHHDTHHDGLTRNRWASRDEPRTR